MKISTAFVFAAVTLLTSAVFAHGGDVALLNGDVRVGNYKLISVANSDLLLLGDLACNVSMNSQRRDIVQNSLGQDAGADIVDVSSCYPSNRYAQLSVSRLSENAQIAGYNYLLSLELADNIPRFPIPAYSTEHHAALARCTQNQNRLTCSILKGGEIVLDLL
jgi:hypothetical protein